MNGAQILLECLLHENVSHIFGMPGGVLIPLYDTFKEYPQIRHILVRHEQGAAFAAEGYTRVSDKPSVCLATSGPGATNLITGIANAHMDSTPLIAITGQVSSAVIGTDAFQEVDITGLTIPITKHNYLVANVKDLPRIIKEAFHIAQTGRPGPVHIDIPTDVWYQTMKKWKYPDKVDLPGYKPTLHGSKFQIKKAAELIQKSKRPVILAGHGISISKASEELKKFIETIEAPVIATLHGIGAIPCDHPYYLGMMGMHGEVSTNYSVQHSDLIIGIGLRFDDRITGNLETFAPHAKVIHVDIDPAEIGKNKRVDIPIVGDCKRVLEALNHVITKKNHHDWMKKIHDWRKKHDVIPKLPRRKKKPGDKLVAYDVISAISNLCNGECIVASDVGQHQMWIAQYFNVQHPGTLLNSGGLGSMGFSLPAAMGAKVAMPDKKVWAISGDGGFMMNSQELMTIAENNIKVKIAIMNNSYLGMVRQWQEIFFDKNYSHTKITNPDFVKLAESYGIKAMRASTFKEALDATRKAHEYNDGPVLVEYVIKQEENVWPIVPPGASLENLLVEKDVK